MTALMIPPQQDADIERAKDFLFAVFGEQRWTEEKYLELSANTNRLVELSERRLFVLEMPTSDHQDIVLILGRLFQDWARSYSGRALISPYPVRLWPGKFREPDVMLYSAERRERVGQQYGGPPDLVVEVLSPGTEKTDTEEKLAEYAQAEIPEYWIVATESPRVEQYVLSGNAYRLHARVGPGESVRAATLADLEAPVDSIYAVG